MSSPTKNLPTGKESIVFCSRGSALARAQTGHVIARARKLFPRIDFQLEIIRTTGDQMTSGSAGPAQGGAASTDATPSTKGLFTKELEVALLEGRSDIAVHSLKDLPTELPDGLVLAATPERADVREVLIYRDAASAGARQAAKSDGGADWRPGSKPRWDGKPGACLATLPPRASVATSSTRRAAQLRHLRRDLEPVAIRGNVGTRLEKLLADPAIDALLLAHAGLSRLGFFVSPAARLTLDPHLPFQHGLQPPPPGLLATILEVEEMLPAVGQGALALEIRQDCRPLVQEVISALNHTNTFQATQAERSFLQAMGGGCQSPLGAFARVVGHQLWLRVGSYQTHAVRLAEGRQPVHQARELGQQLAAQLR